MRRVLLTVLTTGFLASPVLAQQTVKPAQVQPLEKARAAASKADIYDEKADARQLVTKAVAKARHDQSRVLVMLGGNWCGWCHKLHELFRSDREIATTLRNEYVLTMIDTRAENADTLMKDWEVDSSKGVPYLVVLDGEGKVVTRQETGVLEEGDHHVPARVLSFLESARVKSPAASEVLADALSRAASQDKRVFLHFGAPWCGWCHRLEDFLAQPEIAALMSRDYIDVKIDTDRMPGGQDMLNEYCKKPGGIPWTVVLDSAGKPIITSDAAGGNIGYPAEDHEIAHFMAMLRKSARNLQESDLKTVETALKTAGEALRTPAPRAAQ